jgi:MADS-box transcription factor
MLMRHWAPSESSSDQKSDSGKEKDAKDPTRSQTLEVNHMMRSQMNGNMVNGKQNQAPTSNPPPRTNSTPTLPSITPLGRTNSIADPKRPRLKVQIPIDQSDDEANTGTGIDMSDSRSNVLTPIRDPGLTPGPVLPPPSPSAPALLSAGATGPPNPFARPLHPAPNGSQRNGDGRGDMDTPISALPSRFMSDNLLPSPSSFYNEWGFGRGGTSSGFGGGGGGSVGGAGEGSSAGGAGNGSNLLPSPLTFQTPVNAMGPSFRDAAPGAADEAKRKLGDEEVAGAKRIKT